MLPAHCLQWQLIHGCQFHVEYEYGAENREVLSKIDCVSVVVGFHVLHSSVVVYLQDFDLMLCIDKDGYEDFT